MTQMRDRMIHVAEQIRTQMDLQVLEGGWELFRRFAIVSLQPEDNQYVRADVRDKKAYEVLLHTEQVNLSQCSCEEGPLCRHVAAAFFQAYNLYGHQTASFLASCRQYRQWLKEDKPVLATTGIVPAPADIIKPVRPSKKIVDTAKLPLPTHSTSEWAEFFAVNFDFKEDIMDTPIQRSAAAYNEYANSDLWEPVLRNLYRLHVQLYLLRAMDRESGPRISEWTYMRMQWRLDEQFSSIVEEIEKLLEECPAEEAIIRYPSVVASMIHYIVDSEEDIESSSINWTSIYQLMWEHLFIREDWQTEEYSRVERKLEATDNGSKTDLYLQHAAAWHDVMHGRDSKAMERLRSTVKHDKHIYYWRILYYHADREHWSKLLHWCLFVMPSMERATRGDWAVFMKAWSQGADQQPDELAWHRLMTAYLHHTYWYYSEYLLKKGLYHTWIDIHLYRGISPLEINKEMLRQVEQQEQQLLLPLYHQAAERSISHRNRDAYRDAVKLMKKLKLIYKAIDCQPAWDRYIHGIVTQHARLRALQEEIKKGKLLL